MSNSSNSSSSGIGVLGWLGVVFVTLKLTGYIDWSWWYVTLPFWGGFAILLAVLIVWLIGWVILEIFRNKKRKTKITSGSHKST